MTRYIFRRLLLTFPVIWGVVTLVFFLIHFIPGDPVEVMLGETAQAVDKEHLRHELGLDKPIGGQYGDFLLRLVQGDWGQSLHSQEPVLGAIAGRIRPTVQLAFCAVLVALTIALPLGIAAAVKQDSLVDNLSMFLALLGISLPHFWLGPLLIMLFALQFPWLPIGGYGGLTHLILPAVTLGSAMSAILTRLIRSTMLEVLREDYIVTARAKGVRPVKVLCKHALKNALMPVITIVGLQLGALLTGSIITETIFSWPGIGRLIIQAINARDYPLVQGCVLVIALSYVLINLLTDLAYAYVDPRIRYT
ncbi:MAG: ABC transporter permease [Candidatus Schekmanbacteria bacterium]|nr:ABC transporter permease [Candidatus Schekmanbacteria bacterium]